MVRARALRAKLWRDLLELRAQIGAIALVLACGVGTWIAFLATLSSLSGTMDAFYARHRFADAFVRLVRAPEETASALREIPGVRAVQTRTTSEAALAVPGCAEVVTGRILSIPDAGEPLLDRLFLRRGRMPDPARPEEVLVSEAFAAAHGLEPGSLFSAVLEQRRRPLRVSGIALSPETVYVLNPASLLPDERLYGVIWMRRSALAPALDLEGAFNDAALALQPDAEPAEVLKRVDRILAPYGGTGAYLRADQPSHWFLANEAAQLRSIGRFMPGAFIGIAAFLIHVVFARLVSRQRGQIGLLKALGYRPAAIGAHYAAMALVAAAAGTALGLLAGSWMGRELTELYARYFRFPDLHFTVGGAQAVQAGLIGMTAALTGAWSAVWRAVRLAPAAAMQPPAPARFRRLPGERLLGFARWAPAARMVARSLARRPLRSAISAAGLATGVALLIVGNALMDSVAAGMDAQFRLSSREDATVVFARPRSAGALDDLRALPGVRRVEGFRSVPVRLTSGHRSRRAALHGMRAESGMQRLLGADGVAVALPREGLVLAARLAAVLGVEPGDVLRVEILEDRPRFVRIPVARVVESFFGLGAWMEERALHRLLGEQGTLSGALLDWDPAAAPDAVQRLQQTPGIRSVGTRDAALRAFSETAETHMRVTSAFLLLFAAVIACGIVYNHARLSLSERERDFASLRVIGYLPREVSAIFLGEIAALTLLALPFGALLGRGLAGLVVDGLQTELYHLNLVVLPSSYATGMLAVAAASAAAAFAVRRRLNRLDPVVALKAQE